MSPALAGGFLTTAPPGKSLFLFLNQINLFLSVSPFTHKHMHNVLAGICGRDSNRMGSFWYNQEREEAGGGQVWQGAHGGRARLREGRHLGHSRDPGAAAGGGGHQRGQEGNPGGGPMPKGPAVGRSTPCKGWDLSGKQGRSPVSARIVRFTLAFPEGMAFCLTVISHKSAAKTEKQSGVSLTLLEGSPAQTRASHRPGSRAPGVEAACPLPPAPAQGAPSTRWEGGAVSRIHPSTCDAEKYFRDLTPQTSASTFYNRGL